MTKRYGTKTGLFIATFFLTTVTSACSTVNKTPSSEPKVDVPDGGYVISPPVPVDRPSNDNFIPLSGTDSRSEQWETIFGGQLIVRNTTSAGLYVYKPSPNTSNGHSVIVLPGGGHYFVSMANEGFPVAEHLAAEGYTAFVLKYRVRPAPRDGQAFLDTIAPGFMTLGKSRLSAFEPAVDDFLAAIKYLKAECKSLGCDGSKISTIGFSAGARTIMDAGKTVEVGDDLESVALLYPPTIDTFDVKRTMPLFVGIAVDDPLFEQGKFDLVSDWLERGSDLEFHLYSGGGHGFGMSESKTTSQNWVNDYVNWLGVKTDTKASK